MANRNCLHRFAFFLASGTMAPLKILVGFAPAKCFHYTPAGAERWGARAALVSSVGTNRAVPIKQ